MKIANVNGRAALVFGEEIADLATVSDGRFGPDPMPLWAEWDEFVAFASGVVTTTGPLDHAALANPVPRPRQVFAIGLNYASHAAETGREVPTVPPTFTKYPASLAGPYDDIRLPGNRVDWEVELVAVIGRDADRVSEADGWSHVAGLTVGQDISDRYLQQAAGAQFSLGKSHRGFGPMGPWVVTLDELDDPDDLALTCILDGEVVQDGRSSDLVFSVPRLVAELSAVVPLLAGDVIFTGTPAGVGVARDPQRFLQAGQVLESRIEGIGTIRNHIR